MGKEMCTKSGNASVRPHFTAASASLVAHTHLFPGLKSSKDAVNKQQSVVPDDNFCNVLGL